MYWLTVRHFMQRFMQVFPAHMMSQGVRSRIYTMERTLELSGSCMTHCRVKHDWMSDSGSDWCSMLWCIQCSATYRRGNQQPALHTSPFTVVDVPQSFGRSSSSSVTRLTLTSDVQGQSLPVQSLASRQFALRSKLAKNLKVQTLRL